MSIFENFCLNCRHFVIFQNEENLLLHIRAMVILIKKIFDSFVLDDADLGHRARHEDVFIHTLPKLNFLCKKNCFLNFEIGYINKFYLII